MKAKKSAKVVEVKDSPSSLAFSSPAKRKLLSDLTTARANVKNKFKKAYMERMRREREMDKIFKPVTKKLASMATSKKKKNGSNEKKKEREEEEESNVENGDAYSDDSLDDSVESRRDIFSTPTSLVKPSSSPRLRWTRRTDGGRTADQMFGNNWRRTTLDDLLRQTSASPESPFVPKARSTMSARISSPEKPLSIPNTPDMSRIEVSFPTLQSHTRRAKKKDLRTMELKRLDTSLNNIDILPSASRFRNSEKRGQFRKAYGESIQPDFIPYTVDDHIKYEYFDDPNELCERLRLLTASRAAGNTNHAQEINSILEELRELGHIH